MIAPHEDALKVLRHGPPMGIDQAVAQPVVFCIARFWEMAMQRLAAQIADRRHQIML